jgi:putative membrane protein
MLRALKLLLIALVTIIFVDFAIVNRQALTISLYPLPYEATLPAFLFAMLCFILGSIIGWLTISLRLAQTRRLAKTEHKQVVALQTEIQAMQAMPPVDTRLPEKLA